MRELSKTGLPIGILIPLELGLFTVVTYLMGLLGTEVLAAHLAYDWDNLSELLSLQFCF